MNREVDGYITDVEFTFDYEWSLCPTLLRLLAACRSVQFPASRPLRYLELGYGTGVPFNIHAAACTGEYWGTDINARHVASASGFAQISGSGAKVLDLSFADLLKQTDLPQFDVIVAHGVWSWVSEANRGIILELLRRHLVSGGLCYMNWVAMPNAAEFMAFQRLLRLSRRRANKNAGTLEALDGGIALAAALRDADSPYFAVTSRARGMFETNKNFDRHYLVHEFLHEHWRPFLFSEVAERLREAGLQFVSSVRPRDQFDDLLFGPAERALLGSLDDLWTRESVKDFLTFRRQRGSIFVKRAAPVDQSDSAHIPHDSKFILIVPEFAAITRTTTMPESEVGFDTSPYREMIALLAKGHHEPKTFGELLDAGMKRPVEPTAISRAIMVMIAKQIIEPVQSTTVGRQAADSCARLNGEILRRSLTEDRITTLASPVTGGGVTVSRIERLCMMAIQQGAESTDQWAKFALDACERAPTGHSREDIIKEALYFQMRLPALAALELVEAGTWRQEQAKKSLDPY